MKFKEWLLNEISDIVKGPISLYHGSFTGDNNEILQGFLKNGAQSSGGGYGQGGGFYVWTNLAEAKKHALNRKSGEISGKASYSGMPMVVVLQMQDLDFKNWDLDLEHHTTDVVDYAYKKFDKIKKLGQVPLSQQSRDYLRKDLNKDSITSLYASENNPIPADFGRFTKYTGLGSVRSAISSPKADGTLGTFYKTLGSSYGPFKPESGSKGSGETLAPFYYAHQDASKGKHEKIEAWFFKKNYGKKTMLLKYTGQQPLPVSQILVFNGTDWVPAN